MPTPEQTYANHRRLVPTYHVVAFGLLVVHLAFQVTAAVRGPATERLEHVVGATLGFALLLLFYYARAFALVAQDRIIRLEERLRLRELLPAALHGRIHELTPRQLVALRFASDEEIPELVPEVLDGRLADPRAIKQRIRRWRADHLRV